MDITLLSRMVKDLLQQHDVLSLPSLGSFRVETAEAVFTDKGFAITPPYKVLSFSSDPSQDNLLAECYAKANGIEPTHSKRLVSEFCAALKEDLRKVGDLEFPGLGHLKAASNGTLFFVADENLKLCPAYDILEKISLRYIPSGYAVTGAAEKPEKAITAQTTAADTAALSPGSPPPEKASPHGAAAGRFRPAFKWLTTVAAIILLALALLAALGRVAPDLADKILYDSQQREMIDYLKD